eukprot:CAMPEP_0168597014 /NCGR_PEP_ID=MMETSP0420-20121227/10364_1 /TAXON_ID=498008 /ORGANISM="Pessonella sp." /LENGTH=96 /DNA_ID=CAMNT_0008633689 /DNA_START=18 /DNA_END=308 /DNA_ORIENTATION=+
MSFHHIVLLSFKEDTTDEQKKTFFSTLDALKDVPNVISVKHGKNVTDRAKGFEYGLVVVLKDRQAELDYQKHDLHIKVLDALKPIKKDVLAMDFDA